MIPAAGARRVLGRGQGAALLVLAAAAVAAALAGHAALQAAAAALTLLLAVAAAWRLAAGFAALGPDPAPPPPLPESDLPRYTVLIPVVREADSIPGLVAHLAALDYPADRLQILVLTEADDGDTTASARAAVAAHPHMRVAVVPPGTPRTKPRACTWGLAQADGALLVVFDAEDRPEPDQLRRAAAAFAAGGADLLCVQAGLDCYNARTTWLTRLFAAEYAAWFAGYLPGLARLGAPVPLGGTSNHLRTEPLRALGGWDAWNVAEDADLGMRLAQAGGRTAILPSTTWEEATSAVAPWLRQRSRWCKGWIQTWLVHARLGPAALARMGWVRAAQMHLLLASTVLGQLLTPPCWLLTGLWLAGLGGWMRDLFPPALTAVAAATLVVGNALVVLQAMAACLRRGHGHLVPWCLLLPAAWLLAGVAAWRGLHQLAMRPFHWEKTTHGVAVADEPPAVPVAARAAEPGAAVAGPVAAAAAPAVVARGWPWWAWAAVAGALLAVLAPAAEGVLAQVRVGVLRDLAAGLDAGRQGLLIAPWLAPLPTLLLAPFAALPGGWPWPVLLAALLAAAGPALAGLLGGSGRAALALVALAALLGPGLHGDLLPALAFAVLALAAQRRPDAARRTLAAPAWAAAALCHPAGAAAALLALAVARGPLRFVHAIALAYAAGLVVVAWLLVFARIPAPAPVWPPPGGDAAAARAEFAALLAGPLSGRAVVVPGPAAHAVGDLLAAADGHRPVDPHATLVPAWERRAPVLVLPAAANPLAAWCPPLDPAAHGLVRERATPAWTVYGR